MPKIVPIDTRQSMFEEPSRGSKHTMYFPCQIKASHTVTVFKNQNAAISLRT